MGVHDGMLSEKLQLDYDLTLDKAINAARRNEAVKQQQTVVRGETSAKESAPKGEDLDAVDLKPSSDPKGTSKSKSCIRCGRSPTHSLLQCPAKDVVCFKCQKKGHFQAHCLSTRTSVRGIDAEEESEEGCEQDQYIGGVEFEVPIVNAGGNPWNASNILNSLPVEFKIDTGADVTVVSNETFAKLSNVVLQKTKRILTGPGQQCLLVCGYFIGTLRYGTREVIRDIYVVKGIKKALLGRPALEALSLVSRINSLETPGNQFIVAYSELFQGRLGTMKGEYCIKLRPGAQPFSLSTPRRIALPLLPKVKHSWSVWRN